MAAVFELFNKREAAKILKISTVTLDRLRQSGQMPYRRVGSQVRFLPEDIEVYLEKASVKEAKTND
jgi:excisionase family DNA binding protein